MTAQPADPATDVQAEVPGMKPLTALDRCERCGAQAYVVTQHEHGALLWCAHHYGEHEDRLGPLKVLDERDKINT